MEWENKKIQLVDCKSTGCGAGLQQTSEERVGRLTEGYATRQAVFLPF
jgi:hypothetical protein